jgi:transcriptional regulator with XRE-family HTH domain
MSLVGDTIRAARRRAGMTQQDVGRRAGVTKCHVSLCETGRAGFGPETVAAVAAVVGLDPRRVVACNYLQRIPPDAWPDVAAEIGRRRRNRKLNRPARGRR